MPLKPGSEYLTLYKMGYARESFKHVCDACAYVRKQKIDRSNPILYPLFVSMVVLYCRPFGRNKVIGGLSELMVPKSLRYLHGNIKDARDQVVVHTDGYALPHGPGGPPSNNVIVSVKEYESALEIYEISCFSPEALVDLERLCKKLIEKTTRHIDRVLRRMVKKGDIPIQKGKYMLNLATEKFVKTSG